MLLALAGVWGASFMFIKIGDRELDPRLVVTGLVNSAIPIYAISWAETRIDSGLTAIFQASAPLFTALLAVAFVHVERVTGARLAGLLVGFGGVAMLVGVQPKGEAVAGLALVFSALCYAIAALWTSRRMRDVQ